MSSIVSCSIIEKNHEKGFASYRVPGIITAADGSLLLTYEARKEDGNIRSLFLQRGIPGVQGEITFGERILMKEPEGTELLHNPMLLGTKEGDVFFFYCRDYGRLFVRVSHDMGCSFGDERELTEVINGFCSCWPVTLWAIAPGHGIELVCEGPAKGRLIVPLWLSRGENAHLPAAFGCIYSDDKGETWKTSNVVAAGNGVGDPTEASIAERSDGSVLATMRHEISGCRKRAFCEETAAGSGIFSEAWLNECLPDPICHGALLRRKNGAIAFLNLANEDLPALEKQRAGEKVRWSLDARKNLTFRMSTDDGRSFDEGVVLQEKSGASDMAESRSGEQIYVFCEQGWEQENCIFNKELRLYVLV